MVDIEVILLEGEHVVRPSTHAKVPTHQDGGERRALQASHHRDKSCRQDGRSNKVKGHRQGLQNNFLLLYYGHTKVLKCYQNHYEWPYIVES